jgi:hypothetical protein
MVRSILLFYIFESFRWYYSSDILLDTVRNATTDYIWWIKDHIVSLDDHKPLVYGLVAATGMVTKAKHSLLPSS